MYFGLGLPTAKATAQDHFDRIHSRVLDSVQFKIQSEINLKDDEISRLRNDLAFFRGRIETISDTIRTGSKTKVEQYSDLKKKLFEAQSKLSLQKTQMGIEHARTIQKMERQHTKQLNNTRAQLEQKRGCESSDDSVDLFVNVLRSATSRAKNTANRKRDRFNVEKYELNQQQLTRYEMQIAENQAKLVDLQRQIDAVRDRPIITNMTITADLSEDFLNDTVVNRDDEYIQEEMEKIRSLSAAKVKRLNERYNSERHRGEALKEQIADAKIKAAESLKLRKIEEGKRNREIQAQNEVKQKKFQELKRFLNSMTQRQKEAKLKSLQSENVSLKKEIARLDWMIYGRASQYRDWKRIQMA